MILTPTDIACYLVCPMMHKLRRTDTIIHKPTLIERYSIEAFIQAEKKACLEDTIVTSKRLLKEWDNIWWPKAMANRIPVKEADKVTLTALHRFSDYCKYDISGWLYPTVGVNIEALIPIGNSTLKVTADTIKLSLEEKIKVIVTFGSKKLASLQAIIDPITRILAYAFYDKNKEDKIMISYIYINEAAKNIEVTTSFFRREDIDNIRKMLNHAEYGIRTGAYYRKINCGRCSICKNLQ